MKNKSLIVIFLLLIAYQSILNGNVDSQRESFRQISKLKEFPKTSSVAYDSVQLDSFIMVGFTHLRANYRRPRATICFHAEHRKDATVLPVHVSALLHPCPRR